MQQTIQKLTQPQQDRRYLCQRAAGCSPPVVGLRPADPGAVEPGVNVVPAESFGLGHQLLVGGRAVKHLGREHRGAAQHLHARVTDCAAHLPPPPPLLTAATSAPGLPLSPPSLYIGLGRLE
ncbi:hypothetical protein EYF80_061194 [Liparis tanakae]|uniref:Uncharacterized protein n=1 Tax=Liparis tanakae TaxID=230148 RepID=A0A4Z2EIM9_9TELE|nr:hypothetical protein EYF80_061194 [Liparis tanakae]